MTAQPILGGRFIRRTQLKPHEYRKNFHQIDADVILAVTSPEADRVTPLMSKVYLRLVSAPAEFWDGPGVLYFTAGGEQGRAVKASKVLYEVLGVASATAHKALAWMHERGIIGYSSGKNGVGIRIFLNRAAGSIGVRGAAAGEKILPFARGSNGAARGSRNEPAFKAPFGDLDVSETEFNPAPASGARRRSVDHLPSVPTAPPTSSTSASCVATPCESDTATAMTQAIPVEEIVSRLKTELKFEMTEVAVRTAARTAQQEMESTREWFETKALPKAVRVAQRETYDLMRKQGLAGEGPRRSRADSEVGRQRKPVVKPIAPRLTDEEVRETAETCVALLETQGKPVEATLAEIGIEGGGWVLAEDVPRVRAELENMLQAGKGE
jgi:hypothetical protein